MASSILFSEQLAILLQTIILKAALALSAIFPVYFSKRACLTSRIVPFIFS